MNLINRFNAKKEKLQLPYTDPLLVSNMNEKIITWLPNLPRDYVVMCIGTDRSTGDALGPLTGTFLSEKKLRNLSIYGTLNEPVHAANLQESIQLVNQNHQNPFIIAVDASLGQTKSIGDIIANTGSIRPGAALRKDLPSIGDMHLIGIVNVGGFMEFSVLQNTRLSVVMDMAKKLALLLSRLDQQLTSNPTFQQSLHIRRKEEA